MNRKSSLVVIALLAAVFGLVREPARAASYPPGFAESTFSTGWNEAVGIAFGRSPDGTKQRAYVWERGGKVWIVEDGVRLATPLLDISDEVVAYRDLGLLSFALDPGFTTNGRFYVMYDVDRYYLDYYGAPGYDPGTTYYFKPTIGRITRYTASVASDRRVADPASRLVLLGETRQTGIPLLHESHTVGSLVFGTDGTLVVTCGEGASYFAMDNGGQAGGAYGDAGVTDGVITAAENIGGFRSQLLDSLSGKMLRIDPATGNGVASNPFYQAGSPRSARSRIWARGLRNPFRCTKRPGTGSTNPADGNPGAFYFGDVGWSLDEELNVADTGGRNFGWPIYEGMYVQADFYPVRPAGMDAADHFRPIIEWRTGRAARVSVGGAIYDLGAAGTPVVGPSFPGNCSIGGTWYSGTDFPADYQGTYFHADFGEGWIKNFKIGANNEIQEVRPFASGLNGESGLVFVTTHPETGALYYITFGGPIMKVEFLGATPPLAKAGAHRKWGPSPLAVNFSSLGSNDTGGGSLRYSWNFGDGTNSTLANPSHTYTAAGATIFNATLTVYNAAGLANTTTVPIHVNNSPPRVRITSPANLTHYPLGQGNVTYALTADVSDAESANGALTYSWITSLHHDNHHHDEPSDPNPSTTAVITPEGPSGASVYSYDIHLTVTDPQGLSTTDEVHLFPNIGALPVTTVADSASVNRGGGAWIAVLANDYGGVTDADFTSIQVVSAPAHGTTVLDPLTGWIRYLHNGDAAATDAFTYRVTTTGGAVSAVATVSIAITPFPSATTTASITGGLDDVEEPASGALNTTATDLDLGLADDGLAWTVAMRFGALAVPQGATITSAKIQFTTDDSPSSITPVSLTIRGEAADSAALFDDVYSRPSFRPVTTSSAAWAPPAWPTAGERAANQLTPNLSGIVQEIVNRGGWASGNNVVMFVTGTGHVEGESYDGALALNDLNRVPQLSVTFNGWNNRPLARSDSASVNAGQSVAISVAANDLDPESLLAPTAVQIASAPEHGWVSVNAGTGQITYTNDGAPNTRDAFTYTVADTTGARSAPATVFVTVVMPPPVAVPDAAQMHLHQKVLLDVRANDTGVTDPASVTVVAAPASGTASVNAQGRILYTHTTGSPAGDSFTYRVSGPGGLSAPATVSISFATALRIANSLLNVSTFPQNLSDTGVFADLTDLSPAPGLLPYSVNVPSWSDFAIKRRWFIVPDGLGDFTYNHDGAWGVPDGTVWVQHFDLDLTRGNPATRRRVETRLLVKNPAGISGVSYRWNDAQTGATLAPDAGVDIPFNVIESGVPRVQTWRIPSRAECTACHTSQAGFALSFTTRQLNLAGDMNGFSGNQIGLLEAHGFLTNSAGPPNLLPRHVRPDENAYSIEARVRSYLDVNCANCHRPGGTAAPSVWDGRVQVILAQTGLLNVSPVNNLGNTLNKLIVPADIAHSVVLSRIAVTNGFTRMPPLASNELDATDIALVTNWISNSLPSRQSYDQWRQQYFGNTTSLAGAPTADPDGDGVTNQNEFLTGTNPVQSASAMRLNPVRVGGTTTFQFNVPENRSFLVEESTNLATWQPMNIPGNDGVPRPAGPVAITAPITGARAFYRVRFWEN